MVIRLPINQSKDQYPPDEARERFDAALRGALRASPHPKHDKMKEAIKNSSGATERGAKTKA